MSALSEVGSSNDLAGPYYYYDPYYYDPYSTNDPALTGTSINLPVTAGTTYQIAVDAAAPSAGLDDGTVVLSINAPPTIVSPARVNAANGTALQYNIEATNNPTAYTATNLPPDLSVNAASGLISGAVAADGTYTIGLSATGPGGTGTATLILQVSDPVPVVLTAPVIQGSAGASGYIGTAFTYDFYATGIPTSYTATNLPAGLSLNTANGVISGTPTATGTFVVQLTATNAAGTGNATVTIQITAAPLAPIITSSLTSSTTVGAEFSYFISTNADGTNAAPTSYAASGLPPGLTLASSTNDYFSGAPTQAGIYPVVIAVTNAGGTRTATVTITVSAVTTPVASGPPQLDSSATASTVVDTAFSYTLQATNSPTAFSASNLPAGLSINPSTGVISGTPTIAGTVQVPVSATNAFGTSSGTLTLIVFPSASAQTSATGVVAPLIVSAAAASGYTGQAFGYEVIASSGEFEGGYTGNAGWTFSATGLPPGLALLYSSGPYGLEYPYGYAFISGTPTTAGTYQTTVSATYPPILGYPSEPAATTTAVVTFVIGTGPTVSVPVITGSADVSAAVGTALTISPSVTNSPTSYAASGLPAGLSINTSTGVTSGTPTTAGTYQVAFSATNSAGTASATIEYVVVAQSVPLITSYAVSYGAVGTAFTYTITSSPASASYGATGLPPGLSCNASTGVISGTPSTAGVYTVPISATGAIGTSNATVTITISSTGAGPVPVITSNAAAQATVGTSYYYYINATGSPTSYTAGNLPPGLSVNTYGEISGTPTAAGTYSVPISATSAAGSGNATLTLIVSSLPAPALSGSAVVNATVNSSFYYYIQASGSPASYAASGLPAGATLNTSTGALSGTIATAGSYPVTISATNPSGTSSATLTINVTPAAAPVVPVITSPAGATGIVGNAFS